MVIGTPIYRGATVPLRCGHQLRAEEADKLAGFLNRRLCERGAVTRTSSRSRGSTAGIALTASSVISLLPGSGVQGRLGVPALRPTHGVSTPQTTKDMVRGWWSFGKNPMQWKR